MPGGVYLPGGVPAQGQGECTCLGDTCLGGVPAQGGVPAWGVYLPKGCTCPGGVPAGGCTCLGGVPAQVLPSPCGQTDRCKNITSATLLRTVKICDLNRVQKQWNDRWPWPYTVKLETLCGTNTCAV